jgi:hypothetical protein
MIGVLADAHEARPGDPGPELGGWMMVAAFPGLIRPGDQVLVVTSGHSPGSPNERGLVLELVGRHHSVLHLRLDDGREIFHVPQSGVTQLSPPREGAESGKSCRR